MPNGLRLEGETVVFTGTLKTEAVFERVKEHGGEPISLPLIQVNEIIEMTDELRLNACASYDWLIFTSQSAVASFYAKLDRFSVSPLSIGSKIAAVGTRTASALEKIGFTVDFIPTVFSADIFVQEFNPAETETRRLLFLRGSLAGPLIKEELPFDVDEWTVYATERADESIGSLIRLVQQREKLNILFASPSAVEIYAKEVVPQTGWNGYTIGAIGHVTEKALLDAGATVHVIPETYTLMDLVNKLADQKEG